MAINRLSQSSVQNGLPKFDTVWDGYSNPSSMDSIAATTLTSNTASVTFSSIPQTYSHLHLRMFFNLSGSNNIYIRFNGDTGSNYSYAYLFGNGSSASANGAGTQTGAVNSYMLTSSTVYGINISDILDYTSTNRNKTIRSIHGMKQPSSDGNASLYSNLWVNTNAITSITILAFGGENLLANSSFALYGVK